MKKFIGVLAGISVAALLLLNPKRNKDNELSFYDYFADGLKENGIEILNAKAMSASLVGAIDGIKFSTLAGDIEIYHFDENDIILKKAKTLGKFSADGQNFYDVVVNGAYMLWVGSLPQNIIDIFMTTTTEHEAI